MKKPSAVIGLLMVSVCVTSVQVFGHEDTKATPESPIVEIHNQRGIMSDISYLGSLSIGLGLSLGKTTTTSGHFFGYNTGAIISYCFGNTMFALRPFFHLYGGSAGIMLGTSIPLILNANSITIGISPEVGVSLFGLASLYYRYNFYLLPEFSSHEVGLTLLYSFRRESKQRLEKE